MWSDIEGLFSCVFVQEVVVLDMGGKGTEGKLPLTSLGRGRSLRPTRARALSKTTNENGIQKTYFVFSGVSRNETVSQS